MTDQLQDGVIIVNSIPDIPKDAYMYHGERSAADLLADFKRRTGKDGVVFRFQGDHSIGGRPWYVWGVAAI